MTRRTIAAAALLLTLAGCGVRDAYLPDPGPTITAAQVTSDPGAAELDEAAGECDTSTPGAYSGCDLQAYVGQPGDGPPLPASLAGQRYSCLVMADTSECVVIYTRDPATGWCIEMIYVAPRAIGTEQGWRKGDDDVADYLCTD